MLTAVRIIELLSCSVNCKIVWVPHNPFVLGQHEELKLAY